MSKNMYEWDEQMIKDFINPSDSIRAIGRTELLIELYCDIAIENPEVEVLIQDHSLYNLSVKRKDLLLSPLYKEVHKRNKIFIERGTVSRLLSINETKCSVIYTRNYDLKVTIDEKSR